MSAIRAGERDSGQLPARRSGGGSRWRPALRIVVPLLCTVAGPWSCAEEPGFVEGSFAPYTMMAAEDGTIYVGASRWGDAPGHVLLGIDLARETWREVARIPEMEWQWIGVLPTPDHVVALGITGVKVAERWAEPFLGMPSWSEASVLVASGSSSQWKKVSIAPCRGLPEAASLSPSGRYLWFCGAIVDVDSGAWVGLNSVDEGAPPLLEAFWLPPSDALAILTSALDGPEVHRDGGGSWPRQRVVLVDPVSALHSVQTGSLVSWSHVHPNTEVTVPLGVSFHTLRIPWTLLGEYARRIAARGGLQIVASQREPTVGVGYDPPDYHAVEVAPASGEAAWAYYPGDEEKPVSLAPESLALAIIRPHRQGSAAEPFLTIPTKGGIRFSLVTPRSPRFPAAETRSTT